MTAPLTPDQRKLADLFFVESDYREKFANEDNLLLLLRGLGAELEGKERGVPCALKARLRQLARQGFQAAGVQWDKQPARMTLWANEREEEKNWRLEIQCDNGDSIVPTWRVLERSPNEDLKESTIALLEVAADLPMGRHRILLHGSSATWSIPFLQSLPTAFEQTQPTPEAPWAAALPTYSTWNEPGVGPRHAPSSLRVLSDAPLHTSGSQNHEQQLVEEQTFFETSEGKTLLRDFLLARPWAPSFAAFCLRRSREPNPWWEWPVKDQDPSVRHDERDKPFFKRTLYAACLAQRHIESFHKNLCIELPPGVDPLGYDAFSFARAFHQDLSLGTPRQNWDVPVPNLEQARTDGYDLLWQTLTQAMQPAGLLRHSMDFSRQFYIPKSSEATQGLYVLQPKEELTALFHLASHTYECGLVFQPMDSVLEPSPDAQPMK